MNNHKTEEKSLDSNVFLGLAHIGIFTADFEKTVFFYTKILPFEIVWKDMEEHPGDESGIYPLKVCIVRLNELYMEIIETNNKGWTADYVDGAFNHVGIRVSDIDEAIHCLKKRGLDDESISEISVNPYTVPGKVSRSCRIRGYNGENIGLYELDNDTYYNLEG